MRRPRGCGEWCMGVCGFVLLVINPMVFFFALFSRVRFFMRNGNLDAEWQDVGIHARKYTHVPSKTPTWVAQSRTLSYKQIFVRSVADPASELEGWEVGALVVILVASLVIWVAACLPEREIYDGDEESYRVKKEN